MNSIDKLLLDIKMCYINSILTRDEYVMDDGLYVHFSEHYSWAVPSNKVLIKITNFIEPCESLLSVCCGNGLWEFLIKTCMDSKNITTNPGNVNPTDRLGTVIATDHAKSKYAYMEIDILDAREAVQKYRTECLFICWPPYNEAIATLCLKEFTGSKLIYIGEPKGGCTADDDFFTELSKWQLVEIVNIPSWPYSIDRLFLYKRKI
jgi:hypothetical protein